MSDNTPIRLKLPGDHPLLTVEVLPRGLAIHRLIVKADGRNNDIVIGPEKAEDHLTQKYTNTIIGQYANCIPTGTHVLERSNIKSVFAPKANENSQVSLHGGPFGFDAVIWRSLSEDEEPELFSLSEIESIQSLPPESYALFCSISPHGNQGYPGDLLTEVLISLVPSLTGHAGYIAMVYRSKLISREKTVTPVNLSQRWSFNLDASLVSSQRPGAASVTGHEISIGAEYVTRPSEASPSTVEYTSVSALSSHDFRQPRLIGNLPLFGYNDYFLFYEASVSPLPRRLPVDHLQFYNMVENILTQKCLSRYPALRLESRKAGIALRFFTNQSGVTFGSNHLSTPDQGARKIAHGGSGISGQGDSYGPWSAVFIEFHDPLVAFLQPENKNQEDTLLISDELYNNFVFLEISLASQTSDTNRV